MARSDTLKAEIAKLKEKGAALTKDLATHQATVAKASATARKKRGDAARTKSDSTRQSALSGSSRSSS